jgi:hypothetical protein
LSLYTVFSTGIDEGRIMEVEDVVLSVEETDMLDHPEWHRRVSCTYLPPFATLSNFHDYQEFCQSILNQHDYERIGGKTFVKRTGWRKLALAFQVSFQQMSMDVVYDANGQVQRATFVERAILPCGRFVDGWGSCSRGEKTFSKPNHDIPATAETRAKNRACQDLFGMNAAVSG